MSNPSPITEWVGTAAYALVLIGILYASVAVTAFGWRHPWATETEKFIHFFDAMTWRTVDYDDMRKR